MTGVEYIDQGDRVIVTAGIAEPTHQRLGVPAAAGQHGVVLDQDGWGLCTVRLDNGAEICAWNGKDLEREP